MKMPCLLPFLFFLASAGCFFPNQGSDLQKAKSAKRLEELAAPLIQHMRVSLNDQELVIRNHSTQTIQNDLQATLIIIPLARKSVDDSEKPCVAGFLRVDNLGDYAHFMASGAQICYDNNRIQSQLEDVQMQIKIQENQTCLVFDHARELSPRGMPGDFATMVWYVCESDAL